MKQDDVFIWLLVAISLGMMGLVFHWLFRKADAANVADWGGKWQNRLDGLNRLFLRRYHKCQIDPVPLPEEGPALVVANHISGLDPMMMIAACQRPVHFIIASEQYYRFGLNWLFRLGGCIPVDRSSRDDSAFRAALQALHDGKVVGLFPLTPERAEAFKARRGTPGQTEWCCCLSHAGNGREVARPRVASGIVAQCGPS
jgi:1-acyl-sn-glycerol-3-phosphate acyltransferase